MSRQFLLTLLGVLGVLLVATIGYEIFSTDPGTNGTPSPAAAPAPSKAPPGSALAPPKTAEWVASILARPLFSPSRKPDAAPVKEAAAAPDQPSNDLPRLAGIQVVGTSRHAIFQPTGDTPPLVVGEGEMVSGWKVETIGLTSVKLTGPTGATTVEPRFDETAVPPAPQMPAFGKPANGQPARGTTPGQPAVRPPPPPAPGNTVPARPTPGQPTGNPIRPSPNLPRAVPPPNGPQ
jgi:hypothetical protein